jgi:dihydroneopterin aldolase
LDFGKIKDFSLKLQEYSIIIKNIKLVLHCGDIKEERILGIETLIDVEIKADKFIDYVSIYKVIEDMAKREFKYLEDFGLILAQEMFKTFKQIKTIIIYLRKKSLPFNSYAQEIGIKLTFERE